MSTFSVMLGLVCLTMLTYHRMNAEAFDLSDVDIGLWTQRDNSTGPQEAILRPLTSQQQVHPSTLNETITEYETIPPHVLPIHLHFIRVLNLTLDPTQQPIDQKGPRTDTSTEIASSVRYPTIPHGSHHSSDEIPEAHFNSVAGPLPGESRLKYPTNEINGFHSTKEEDTFKKPDLNSEPPGQAVGPPFKPNVIHQDPNIFNIPIYNEVLSPIPDALPTFLSDLPDIKLRPVLVDSVTTTSLNTTTSPNVSAINSPDDISLASNDSRLLLPSVLLLTALTSTTTSSTTLLTSLSTLITDLATATSAFLTSLANSGTFTTALNALLDAIIAAVITPLSNASVSTKRFVVLLALILITGAVIKLKKCYKKACYSHYRSFNDWIFADEDIVAKLNELYLTIENYSKSIDKYS